MRYLFTFFLFCKITTSLLAQTSQSVSIFFDHDKAEITSDAAAVLDSVYTNLSTAPDYEIHLNAYTDNTGTDAYNLQLANARANAVRLFLENRGIVTDKMETNSWGEKHPQLGNNTEETRQKNRRVDLEIKRWTINTPEDFQKRIQSRGTQTFTINTSTEQTIRTPSGTMVIIPPGSFVLDDGTEVSQVEIIIKEALTPADWIFNGLSTSSNGTLLQSGGMLFISAFSNGQELQMAEGAELTVAIPASKSVDPDMQLFYGQHDESNNTVDNWQQAPDNTRFRRTLNNPDPVFTASLELCQQLQQMKVDIPPVPVIPQLPALVRPREPKGPHKPRLRPAPQWSMIAKNYSLDGNPKGKKLKKAKIEFAKKQQHFSADSVMYARNLEKYNTQMGSYQENMIIYQQAMNEWEISVQHRLSIAREYHSAIKVNSHAKALAKILANAGKKKVFRFRNLNDAVIYRANNVLSYRYYNQSYIGNYNPDAPVYQALFGSKAIKEDAVLRRKIKGGNRACDFSYTNSSDSLIKALHISCGLKALSDSLYTASLEKTALTGSNGQQQRAMAAYVTEITKLGWINVDKFSKDPSARIALSFNAKEAFAMYAYFPELNSMLMLTKDDETGTFSVGGIPEGQPFKLITIKTEYGQLWVNQQQLVAKKQLRTTFAWTAYSIHAFRKELAML